MFKKLIIALAKSAGVSAADLDSDDAEEEIKQLLDAGGDNGSIEENEMEMIQNIFEFNDTLAGDIATHRTDIVALPIDAGLADAARVIEEEKYSRIPIYEENIDNIVGILHIKDLMKYVLSHATQKEALSFDLRDIIMKPFFVPFSKKTDELFEEMQREKTHMAIIIDEYGGTAGIVTMEDLLEEIVGNIFDEYDVEEREDIEAAGDGSLIINGTADIQDVSERLGLELPEEDYETIGGFLIGQLGRIPEDDERPEISFGGYLFKVCDIEEKRIETICVTKNTAEEEKE